MEMKCFAIVSLLITTILTWPQPPTAVLLLFASAAGNRIVSNFHPSAIVFPLPSWPKAISHQATGNTRNLCTLLPAR